ncbi:LTA synthase family protein [Escherichia coli]
MFLISIIQMFSVMIIMLNIKIKDAFRAIILLLLLLLSMVISIEISSIISIGEYIPTLALANISETNSVGWKIKLLPFLVFLSFMIASLILKRLIKEKKIRNIMIVVFLLSLLIPISPINAFFSSSYKVYSEAKEYNMSPHEISDIKSKYTKEIVTNDSYSHEIINGNGKNILVIFIEGMSSLVISKELTPNLYEFRKKSISFNNYYNHTAATFRGLRGQLTSSYQMTGGYHKDNSGLGQASKVEIEHKLNTYNYITKLPIILEENGYHTYFQASNSIDDPLSLMLSTLKFNHIYGREDYNKKSGELTDKESFDLLFKKLNEAKQPFFYGVYTVGTHLGLDSPDVKFYDGRNEYLNHFHQLDHWFGDFISHFNKTSLSKDTIILITSDHASYPSEDYKKTFKTDNTFFVDQIPLIIWSNGVEFKDINAHGLNSLSLTPTILDILGIKESHNMFIGESLFEKEKNKNELNCTSAIGDLYVKTCNGKMEIEKRKEKTELIKQLQLFGDR